MISTPRSRAGNSSQINSQQLAVRSEKRVRPVERADRNLMRDDVAELLSRKPGMEVERRRLDLERRLAQFRQIQINRVIGRGADRRRHARKHGQFGTVNMAGRDEAYTRVTNGFHEAPRFGGCNTASVSTGDQV